MPSNLKQIGISAFSSCTALQSLTIPPKVTSIDSSAFAGCSSLKQLKVDPNNPNFVSVNAILMDSKQTQMIWVSPASSAIENGTFTIPDGITTVGSGLIKGYANINRVVIPSSVTSINFGFFTSNITSVQMENNNVYQSDGNAIYSKDGTILYKYLAKTPSVTLNEGLFTIEQSAFTCVTGTLKEISLPTSLQAIEDQAFAQCFGLKSLSLGVNVNYLAPLFIYMLDIDVIIDSENENYMVKNKAIYSKDEKTLITVIGSPTSFSVPNGVTTIGDQAFHYKTKMQQVIIPNTVKNIGNAFNYCGSLTNIEIPSSVESIGSSCFSNSSSIKEIHIHKKKGEIPGAPWGAVITDRAIFWDG